MEGVGESYVSQEEKAVVLANPASSLPSAPPPSSSYATHSQSCPVGRSIAPIHEPSPPRQTTTTCLELLPFLLSLKSMQKWNDDDEHIDQREA